jgi:hypothetical protein
MNVAKAFGLSLMAALGLLAFSAMGAQAQFSVGGKTLLATATGSQINSGQLLVPGRNLELECHKGAVNSGHINETGTHATGQVTFSECLSRQLTEPKSPLPCFIKGGSIVANTLIVPVGGNALFSPTAPPNFAVVSYEGGTECPLPLNNPVTGNLIGEVPALEAIKQILVFKKSLQEGTHKLSFGGFASTIHAQAEVSTTGAHAGQALGLHP